MVYARAGIVGLLVAILLGGLHAASAQDQDGDTVPDGADVHTYDFETDTVGTRPAEVLQLGGTDPGFLVRAIGTDQAVSYDGGLDGQIDRFERLPLAFPHQAVTVYLDFDLPSSESLTVELWSDGALGWRAGHAIQLQIDPAGVPSVRWRRGDLFGAFQSGPGPLATGRIRLRLVPGAGSTATLHVDTWNGGGWTLGFATWNLGVVSRFHGLWTALSDNAGGRRAATRVSVVAEPPAAPMAIAKYFEWSDDWKVFQRDNLDEADIPVRAVYRLTEPGTLQARVVEAGSESVLEGHDWTNHQLPLGVAAGEIAELLLQDVPAGGNYHVDVRLVRDSDSQVLAQDRIEEVAVGDVFVCGGQSNMAGYSGSLLNAETETDQVHLFHNSYTWQRAAEPMDGGAEQVDRVSAENPAHSLMLRFAKDVASATGVPVGIIPGPLGGTNLHTQWQRNASVPSHRGTLYGSLLHRVLIQNDPNGIRGYLWYQGESDAGRGTAAYRQDLEEFIGWLRSDLAQPDLPVFVAQLGTFLSANPTTWGAIQEAQRQVARGDANVSLVTTMDQPLADTIHFNVEGYKNIGARFACSAQELIFEQGVDCLAELVEVAASSKRKGKLIELTYDTRVYGGEVGLYTVRDAFGTVPVTSVRARKNKVQLALSRPLEADATLSYRFPTVWGKAWVVDADGVPVPAFQDVPIAPPPPKKGGPK